MRSPDPPAARRRALVALAALLALLMLPNALWVVFGGGPIALVSGLLVPVLLLAALFAAFGSAPWIACVLLVPFAALAPWEAFYVARFRHPSSTDVIASVFATNSNEAIDFLGGWAPALAAATVAAILLAAAAAWAARRARVQWRHRSRRWILAVAVILPLAFPAAAFVATPGAVEARTQSSSTALSTVSQTVASGFPFGSIGRIAEYVSQRNAIRARMDELRDFRFGATRAVPQARRQIYVLVIGESSRRNHWQLFGYGRPTNPELMEEPNLVPISDMETSWYASILAIPMMITRKPMTLLQLSWKEPSIVRVMKEAGFQTRWISNQMAMGAFDSPVAVYAQEADEVTYVNHASGIADTSFDEALLPPLHRAIAATRGDLFVVLHMMGSHLLYDRRYPDAFKRFVPTHADSGGAASNGDKMVNSYDNSILYTDHVLAGVIAELRNSHSLSAMFFASDHGETLPTLTCGTSGHAVGSRYDYEVPALFWYSDEYAQAHAAELAALLKNAQGRTVSANIFESLVDMAGVTFATHDPTWSLFSDHWTYHPRVLNTTTEQVDADAARYEGDCDLVRQ